MFFGGGFPFGDMGGGGFPGADARKQSMAAAVREAGRLIHPAPSLPRHLAAWQPPPPLGSALVADLNLPPLLQEALAAAVVAAEAAAR